MPDRARIIKQTQQWLNDVVLGLNLCPFASHPVNNGSLRIVVVDTHDKSQLLQFLYDECTHLDDTDADTLETTLLVVPEVLADFGDYNDFLGEMEECLIDNGWEGVYQIASFHPNYQFHGSLPNDRENYTNRSPYPVFHLIREASLEAVLARYPEADKIPERNIQRLEDLSEQAFRATFSYLIGACSGSK